MLVVREAEVGAVAFARLRREGLLHERVGTRALPLDVASTAHLRWHLVEPYVAAHTWATGLVALWIRGVAPVPPVISLVGARGLHRVVPPAGAPPVFFRSGPSLGLTNVRVPAGRVGPGPRAWRVAAMPRACVDALTYDPVGLALPAVGRALRERRVTPRALEAAVERVGRRKRGHPRAVALVAALVEAFGDP